MMKAFTAKMGNMKLKNKIAWLFAVLVILSTGLTGLLFYRYAAGAMTRMANQDSAHLMLVESGYFDEKLKELISRLFITEADQTFNDTVIQFLENGDPKYRSQALSYFSNLFAELRYSEPFVASVYLYTPKGGFYDLSLPIDSRNFADSALFSKIRKLPEASVYWFPRQQAEMYREEGNVIPMVLRFNVQGYNRQLYLVVDLSEKAILDYMGSVQSDSGRSNVIMDRRGNIIVSSDSKEVSHLMAVRNEWQDILASTAGEREISVSNDKELISFHSMQVAPWIVIHVQSEHAVLQQLEKMKMVMAVILAALVLCSISIAFIISVTISKPLRVLERTMQQVRRQKFDVRFDYPYQDEVGKLGRTFNFMTREIRDLIEQLSGSIRDLEEEKERVKIEQRLKRMAEMTALQSQMKPHFLYNTLDSIKWMADLNDQTEISRMISAMALYFRIALSKGREIIRVRDELQYVESYLQIQKMRFGDLIEYEIHADEQVMDHLTVKFVLQPLVENAIYHGIKETNEKGRIKITAEEREGFLVFKVKDDGRGIHPVKLQLIRKRLQIMRDGNDLPHEESGFGLYNVHERIQLFCGADCGLRVDSASGHGTEVSATLPLRMNEEENRDV